MRIKTITTLAVASFVSLGFITPALADMPLPVGWYIEGNAGQSKATDKNYGAGNSADDTGFGWGAVAGYKFMPFYAMEIGYTKYAATTIKNSGVRVGKDSHFSYDLAGKGIIPLSNSGAELFAKIGVARLHSNVTLSNGGAPGLSSGSSNKTGYYIGLGGDYAFMPELTAILQWARAKGGGSVGTLDLYSAGLAYIID